jgi:hypothetical protein
MSNPSNDKHKNMQVLEIKTSIDEFSSLITLRKFISDKTDTLDMQDLKQVYNALQYLYDKIKQLELENTTIFS